MRTFEVSTRRRCDLVEVTGEVKRAVAQSGVREGVAFVYSPHTTAGITVNENADPDVVRDFLAHMERLVPEDGGFRHGEGNADSHIKTILTGAAQALPVSGGELSLGVWQGVFLCEFDGPRRRRVHVMVLGEDRAGGEG